MAVSEAIVANLPGSSQQAGDKRPQHIQVVDTSGNVIEAFSAVGGTQYTEGDTDATISGTAVMFETNTGTNAIGVVSSTNPLPITIVSGGGSGGTALTDDAAFTAASTSFTPVGGIVTSDSVDAGDGGAFAMLANRQQKVTLYDSSGNELSVGGGTQYTEDAAAAADPVGTVQMLVRRDTPSTTVSADGDNIAQRGSNYGAAYVTLVDSSGSFVSVGGGTQYTEDAASTADPTGTMQIARRRDTLSGTEVSADGDNIAVNATSKGEVYVKHVDSIPITDNGGNISIDDGGNTITVDGTVGVSGTVTVTGDSGGSLTVDAPVGTPVFVRLSDGASAISTLPVSLASVPSHAVTNAGTFAVQESGAALTALQLIDNLVLAEDAAHGSGDPGVQILSVRTDTATARSGTDGDYQPLITDGSGRLHVNVGNTVDTELPNAAALADNTSNPTAPAVGAFAHVWDGSTWDRTPGNSTEGALVYTKRSLTASSPTTATVGTSSGSAVASNASRKACHLRNTSTSGQRISLHLAGGTAVLDSGITLNVGDVWEMDEYGFTTAAITAISSGASGRLSVQEWT